MGKSRKVKKNRKLLVLKHNLMNDPSITHVMVKKNGMYYRPNACGYTEIRSRAGVFRKEEYAGEIMYDLLDILPVDTEEHNKMILDEIKHLESRLI